MFRFKILIFWLIYIILVFGFIACGDSAIKYEDIQKDTLQIEKFGQGTVKISWNAPKGAVFYKIEYHKMEDYHKRNIIYERTESPSIILDRLELNTYYSFSIRASSGTEWISIKFIPNISKPKLVTTPTNSVWDTIDIELYGEIGTTIFINDIDSGQIIKENGKTLITLYTPSPEKVCSYVFIFYIHLENEYGIKSDVLELPIRRDVSHYICEQ